MAQLSWWLFHDFTLFKKYPQLTFSGSRTVAAERAWISIWNCWLRNRSNSNSRSCYQNAFFSHADQKCMWNISCSLAFVYLSVTLLSQQRPLGHSAFVKHPSLGMCAPYVAFRRYVMRLRRVSSSAWIMQTWWSINLSLWIWSCWYLSLLGNSLRNIKPSFFEVSPNYFFRREKKKYYVS